MIKYKAISLLSYVFLIALIIMVHTLFIALNNIIFLRNGRRLKKIIVLVKLERFQTLYSQPQAFFGFFLLKILILKGGKGYGGIIHLTPADDLVILVGCTF